MRPTRLDDGVSCRGPMSDDAPFHEQLQRVIDAGGVLLRTERIPCTGPAGARASERIRFTFDVGALDLWSDGGSSSLAGDRPTRARRSSTRTRTSRGGRSLVTR